MLFLKIFQYSLNAVKLIKQTVSLKQNQKWSCSKNNSFVPLNCAGLSCLLKVISGVCYDLRWKVFLAEKRLTEKTPAAALEQQ